MLTSVSKKVTAVKAIIWVLIVGHFTYLVYATLGGDSYFGGLGANPIETLTHTTGEWGLNLLVMSLAITPLRRWFHWNVLIRFRRLLGMASFIYLLAHFLIFLIFDHLFDLHTITENIIEFPYIAMGFAGFILMIPLAVTSFSVMQRKMGKYWITLHKLVYLVAVLGVVHYWWLVKADILIPAIYAVVIGVLLGARAYFSIVNRQRLSYSSTLSP